MLAITGLKPGVTGIREPNQSAEANFGSDKVSLVGQRLTRLPPMTDSSEPKKETAGTTVLLDPPAQPYEPERRIDTIPMLFWWALLAASAAILILQIWNYLS